MDEPQGEDDVGIYQGKITDGSVTDDSKPLLSGSGAVPGAIIKIYDGSNPVAIGSTTANAQGEWSFTPINPLNDGPHSITVSQTVNGKESKKSPALEFDVDTVIATPEIDPINPKDPITGTAEPGATVTVEFPDGTTVTTVADSNGDWTVPNPGNLKDGDEVTAVAQDKAGNISSEGKEPVDGVAPTIDINPINPKDPITGETEPGANVTVKFPDGSTVTTVADSNGDWTVPNPGNLKDGDEVTATAKDPAGNEGTAKEPVDGLAPTIDINPINPKDPITGETEPGANVTVKFPDGSTVTTVADSNGD